MKPVLFYSACLLLLLLSACHKNDEQKVSFIWANSGTKFYYDMYSRTDTVADYLTLQGMHNVLFQNNAKVNTWMRLYYDFKLGKDGIYGTACETCNYGAWCGNEFNFLIVPASVHTGQEVPLYTCGREVYAYNKILNADTLITVPQGVYHTYKMQLDNGDISYWNADSGIIMYDDLDTIGTGYGKRTYVLARTER